VPLLSAQFKNFKYENNEMPAAMLNNITAGMMSIDPGRKDMLIAIRR
jgi:hypothetical protein